MILLMSDLKKKNVVAAIDIKEKEFGSIIKENRIKMGWNIKEFIYVLGIPFSPSMISKMENKNSLPSIKKIIRIAEVLNIDRDYLLDASKKQKIKWYEQWLEEKYISKISKCEKHI